MANSKKLVQVVGEKPMKAGYYPAHIHKHERTRWGYYSNESYTAVVFFNGESITDVSSLERLSLSDEKNDPNDFIEIRLGKRADLDQIGAPELAKVEAEAYASDWE